MIGTCSNHQNFPFKILPTAPGLTPAVAAALGRWKAWPGTRPGSFLCAIRVVLLFVSLLLSLSLAPSLPPSLPPSFPPSLPPSPHSRLRLYCTSMLFCPSFTSFAICLASFLGASIHVNMHIYIHTYIYIYNICMCVCVYMYHIVSPKS